MVRPIVLIIDRDLIFDVVSILFREDLVTVVKVAVKRLRLLVAAP